MPAPSDVSTHSIRGVRRRQYQPIWDEVTLTSSAVDVKFFDTIAGKQAHRTNLEKPHELPFREHYEVWGIRVVPRFATIAANLRLFYDLCALEFGINTRPVLKVPMCIVTAGCGLEGVAGYTGTSGSHVSAVLHNGAATPGAILKFDEPFLVGKGETFYLNVKKESTLAGMSDTVVKGIFEGYIWKTTQ